MTLKDYKEKRIENPEFVHTYYEIQPKMNLIRVMVDARISQDLTQKELSERTGITWEKISQIKNENI